jgi:hypothetical protein
MIQRIIVTALVILAGGYVLYRVSRHSGSSFGCGGCSGCNLKDSCETPEDERSECPEQKTPTRR